MANFYSLLYFLRDDTLGCGCISNEHDIRIVIYCTCLLSALIHKRVRDCAKALKEKQPTLPYFFRDFTCMCEAVFGVKCSIKELLHGVTGLKKLFTV